MILTDREILIALSCDQLVIQPPPSADALSSTSLDLTLNAIGSVWKTAPGVPIRPGARGFRYSALSHLRDEIQFKNYELQPQSFVLGWTNETIKLPLTSRLAARVEGKSSLARLGLGIHVTAPTIHAGFAGLIQLEIFNFGPHTLILDEGMKICQLIFEQTIGTPEKGYQGIFANQKTN